MEVIAGDVEASHCGFADLYALLVAARVEGALDLQTGFGRGRADQFDDGSRLSSSPKILGGTSTRSGIG
jgi:hypothetical protein